MDQDRLLQEQIALVQRQVPILLAGNLVVAVALVLIMFRVVPGAHLAIWSALLVALVLARALFYVQVRRAGIKDFLKRRAAQFVGFSFCSGLLWGSAGVISFTPTDPLNLALILLLLAGSAAGTVASTSAYPPIFFVFSIPALTPITVLSISYGEAGIVAAGLFTLVFLLVNLAFCVTIHKTVLESLRLRFENVDLIEALSEQKAVAEKANVAKSKFLAAASHDLRQPLHAQGLLLDALSAEIASPKGQALLAKIVNAKRSLDQLFAGLLDISRLDAGVVTPESRVFNIRSFLRAFKDEFQTEAQEKGLSLGIESENVNVKTDRLLLARILRNLLSNAIRHTDSGEVNLRARTDHGKVFIEVADTGPGIPETELQNIFSEYHQLANPERDRSKGLGLGLAIVDKLVQLLGIEIAVSSQVNSGSTFTLVIDQCHEPVDTQRSRPWRFDAVENVTLLAIDDAPEVLESMQQLFDQWGYRSILASSAADAIEQLAILDAGIDVIIADYRLRDNQTGVEAINLVREEFNLDVPGIIITGDTAPERIAEAERSGYRLLHKPVSAAELRTTIHYELLGHPKLQI